MCWMGHVLYNEKYLFLFGGGNNNDVLNTIYYCDLTQMHCTSTLEWKTSKIRIPSYGRYHAVILNDKKIHIIERTGATYHYAVNVCDLLEEDTTNNSISNENDVDDSCNDDIDNEDDDDDEKGAMDGDIPAFTERLDVRQLRLDSLMNKLDSMQNYATHMDEMRHKMSLMMKSIELNQNNTSTMKTEMKKLQEQYTTLSSFHSDNIDEENKESTKKEELESWFNHTLKLPQYFDLFFDEGFDDLESIKHITIMDLNDIGITKLGHKKKILRQIQSVNDHNQSPYTAAAQYLAPWCCNKCYTANEGNLNMCKLCGNNKNQNIIRSKPGVEGPNVYDTAQ